MLRRALRRFLPIAVGNFLGLAVAIPLFGIQAVIATIPNITFGSLLGYLFLLVCEIITNH